MAKKKVYLIRHGEAEGNAEKRYIGNRTDTALTQTGIAEIGKRKPAAAKVMEGAPVRVCSGPMKRAVDTARLLFDTDSPETVPELTEMDLGCFEGKTYQELSGDPRYQAWIDSNGTMTIPEGESLEAFAERSMRAFLSALGDPDREETVAIVCHGGNIMAVMSSLTRKNYYDFIVGNVDGYILDLEMNDEGILAFSYDRLGFGNPA